MWVCELNKNNYHEIVRPGHRRNNRLIDTLLSNDMNIVSRESEVVSDITVGRGILECYKIGK